MRLLTDPQVRAAIDMPRAIDAVRQAYLEFGAGGAANQARSRTAMGGAMLSTMGAVIPALGVSGAKIYSTTGGRFHFVVVLFDSATGVPLCTMAADALTEIRTAATTAVAADIFCPAGARVLTVFGTGVQARSHVRVLLKVRDFSEVLVCGLDGAEAFAESVRTEYGIDCQTSAVEAAVRQADVVVTATRASEPLFDGQWLQPQAFVAAIGATKPAAREVDATVFSRARHIVVEEKSQACAESGELLALPGEAVAISELGDWLARRPQQLPRPEGITVYKAVGIGLGDVALAAEVWKALQ